MAGANSSPSSTTAIVTGLFSLFVGFGILMLGDGLQATLLAVRANQEGFSTDITGLVMSSFYVGFLGGSIVSPKIIMQVGHVRVFGALAAIASAAILIHVLFINVYVWIVLRLVSGFCFAGLYVVAESWLNDKASNQNRGKILSLYMIVTYCGVGTGQLLLNLAEPAGYLLFMLTSILISLAMLPILLSASSTPKIEYISGIRISEMFKLAPLGMLGVLLLGFVTAGFFSLGPVYASQTGMGVTNISYFMASAVLGTILLQLPIGIISDKFDRWWVIIIIASLAVVFAFFCSVYSGANLQILFILTGLFCGFAIPSYSICIAYINDCLDPSQMVAASGSLVLMNGIGSVAGPVLIAIMMERFGAHYFFGCMCGALTFLVLFALLRYKKRRTLDTHKSTNALPAAYHSSIAIIESMQEYAEEESQ